MRKPGHVLGNLIADLNQVVAEHRELVQKAEALERLTAAVQSLESRFPGLTDAVGEVLRSESDAGS